jgi:methionine-rich copper-binding protein CopC
MRSRSMPSEVFPVAPTQVELWVNERHEDEFSALEVRGEAGRHVDKRAPRAGLAQNAAVTVGRRVKGR